MRHVIAIDQDLRLRGRGYHELAQHYPELRRVAAHRARWAESVAKA